jgi:hypothetical protein
MLKVAEETPLRGASGMLRPAPERGRSCLMFRTLNRAAATWALPLLFGASVAHAVPVISPAAADLSAAAYSADSTAGGSAQSAFNGGYWNAGAWFTHWIQADMGTSKLLGEVRIGETMDPGYVIGYKVYLSDSNIQGNWASLTPVATWSGVSVPGTILSFTFAPTSGRYLEVVATGGGGPGAGSWVAIGGSTPRVNWVDPLTPVPEPASWALMLGGAAALAQLARRRSA